MLKRFLNTIGTKPETMMILSPVEGRAVSLGTVNDEVFSHKILGEGVAIIPEEGKVIAPCDGMIDVMFDTGHAVALKCFNGVELLIHIGLDTVELKGLHYKAHKKNGERVKEGDLLIEFDLQAIREKGYDTAIPIIVCNTEKYKRVRGIVGEKKVLESLLEISV